MAFIRSGNQTASLSLLSFFLSIITLHNLYSAPNHYSQFGLLDNPYSRKSTPYKPLPPTPQNIRILQSQRNSDPFEYRGGHRRDHYLREQEEAAFENELYQKLLIEDAIFAERKKQDEEHAHLREIASKNLTLQTSEIPALIHRATKFYKQTCNSESATTHLANRIKYLEEYLKDPNTWKDKQYYLSRDSSTFLQEHQSSINFNSLYGNYLQHGIHEEQITIISRATTLEKNSKGNPSKIQTCSFIVRALETAHTHKVQGNIVSALEISDVCFHLLDPTQRGYLVPQLAALQTHALNYQSTDLEKAFKHLDDAALHDPELASCIRMASHYVDHFKKTSRDYEIQVLQIVTELSITEFADVPIQEQFKFLEKHHEGIAIKALRSLNNKPNAQVTDYATKIFNLESPQSASNALLLKTLLTHQDSLARTHKLLSAHYHTSGEARFFTREGILHEHAMIADLHQLPLPPQNKLDLRTHELLHAYNTSKRPGDQELAYYGLFHLARASISSNNDYLQVHDLLAHEYYDMVYNDKQSNLLAWSSDLARTYTNPRAQEVHNELIWLTHQFITAESKASTKYPITHRILTEIKDTLIEAHAYNQLNQPDKSHELIKNITDVFVAFPFCSQEGSPFYKGLNLAQSIAKIDNNLNSSIAALKNILENSSATPDEKIAHATQELARLHIQSGRLVRDNSELSQKELDELSERTALQPSRHQVKQTLINKLAHQATKEFDTNFPQFKKNLSQEEYSAHKKKYVHTYYERYKKKAASCPERSLDIITDTIDPIVASIKAADALGFVIHQNNDVIAIEYLPENMLRDFKDIWPAQEVMKDIIELWDNEVPLCAINRQEATRERYAQREIAYQETQNAPYIFIEKSYTISEKSQQLLEKNEIEYDHLTHGMYNPLQDQLHTELLEILEQTTLLDAQDTVEEILRPCNTMMMDFVSTAAHANQQGDIIKTMTLTDFCWGILDCGQAFLEGLKDGSFDALKYAGDHPLETILFAVAGNYMLYYQVSKLTYELTNLAIESYLSEPEENPKPKEPIFFRDLVKGAAHFAAQMGTNYIINHRVNKCIQAGIKELDVIDRLVTEEASALAHDRAPQLARPRKTVQVMTDNGEAIEVIIPHENFNASENIIPSKPSKGGGQNKHISNNKNRVSNKVTEAKQTLGFISDENVNLTKKRSQIAKQECFKLVKQGEGSEIAKRKIPQQPELYSTQFTAEELEFLAKFRPERKDICKTVVDTGERCRIVRPLDHNKAEQWAELEYQKIRNLSEDVTKISHNTGIPQKNIQKIKEHLFYNLHKLRRGVLQFDPDPEIAAAWDRLCNGDFIKNDIKLLLHENAELRYEKMFKTTYEAAHHAIKNTWPYIDPKFIEE